LGKSLFPTEMFMPPSPRALHVKSRSVMGKTRKMPLFRKVTDVYVVNIWKIGNLVTNFFLPFLLPFFIAPVLEK